MPYFSKRALNGLRDYTYKPGGYTILDKLHQPFWNYITDHILPPWLAPNLITLMGLSALMAAYVTTTIFMPGFQGAAPGWVYFATGSACLFYLHMDCLDGKQARKIKNSSPLGQLFDHGCDALAVHLILAGLVCTFNMGGVNWQTIAGCCCVMAPWILAHWEEYHTGVMVYGNGLWGVTEANYCVVLLHYITAVMGPSRWLWRPLAGLAASAPVAAVLPPAVRSLLGALQLNEVVSFTIAGLAALMAVEQLFRVFRLAGTRQLASTTLPKVEQGHKQLGRARAAAHLVQLAAVFVLGVPLLALPSTAVGPPQVAMITFGVVYAIQATRLIMAHMAKEPFEVAIWPLAAMALQLGNAWSQSLDPTLLAYAVNAVVVGGYLHYVVVMINEICGFLGIPCLTVHKVAE